jgi:hypothetical protein
MWHRPWFDITDTLPGRDGRPDSGGSVMVEVAISSPALESLKRRDAYPTTVPGAYITPFQYPGCDCSDGSGDHRDSNSYRCFFHSRLQLPCCSNRSSNS